MEYIAINFSILMRGSVCGHGLHAQMHKSQLGTATIVDTINNKSYAREKLCGFCALLMNHESFPANFEQWQHFQCMRR